MARSSWQFSTLRRSAVPLLLTAACMLAGCNSSMMPDRAVSRSFTKEYTNALMLRAAVDADKFNVVPTYNGGVREYKLARVDATGLPGTTGIALTQVAPTPPATGPGTQFAVAPNNDDITKIPGTFEWTDAKVGIAAAQIHDAETTEKISLEEALSRAMKHNLDILVESYNPAIRALQTMEAESIYDPVGFGSSQWSNTDQPGQVISVTRGTLWQNSIGVRQLLPTGGTVQFSAGDNYADYDSAPGFGAATYHGHVPYLNLALAHPLLRGAGADVTNANIYLAQRDYSISLAQFKRQVIDIAAQVEEAYHNLVLATATVRIQEQLLADTDATRKRVWDRREIDVDAVQYNQSLSAVESRKAELILARSAQRSASDRLKGLLHDRELDLRANTLLVPSDRPSTESMSYNVAEVIDTALRQRPEIQEARLQIERADIIVTATESDLLPKLDLNAAVQSNGGFYENDFANAFYSTVNSARYIDYSAGVKFEMPFGNKEAESRYQRRLLERRQALTGLLNTAQKVVVDVKLQLREVYKSYEEIGARESARVATARELNGLIKKENIVQLTPEFLRLKLDAQLRLALAEIAEIQSMVNYNIAISKLEQSKGTLLEYNHIAINSKPTETPAQKLWLIGQSIEWHNPFEVQKTAPTESK